MMTRTCSARAILGHWYKFAAALVFVAATLPAAAAQDLAAMVKVYRDAPSVARRAQIERFATAHAKDQEGALARLALGVTSLEQKDYDRAIGNLRAAQPHLPKIEDYAIYYLVTAQIQAKDEADIPKEVERFQNLSAASPLAMKAVVLHAKALVDLKNPAEAVRLLR
jgi:predicted negative regulator of RcsB-dependent stress response